ncbi:SsrA-binding protein SmpB [Buchnera aphidicola (Mollitrichosiphum nigrofasciatum)]|uniref:SsrA-binding protein SmpB n=1 Tax=Buchnera aphidicola TaxID=9 RepID=UPI0031B810CF
MLNNKKSIICINKKAQYSYYIKDVYYSGLVLKGWEVKSLRFKKVDISNAYISIINNEFFLINSTINVLPIINTFTDINIKRKRKLLLKKMEIKFLSLALKKKGITCIALSLFWKNNWCKLKFALSQGKKKIDKRFKIKQNDWKIDKMRLQKKNFKKIT